MKSRVHPGLGQKSLLLIGLGGLGCPTLLALANSGLGRVVLCDDDEVSLSNLHRQLLFREADVGRDKLEVARERLAELDPKLSVELTHSRFLPENAAELARSVDVIVEGADNFATKFLAADAAFLSGRPLVQGAGVRWQSTVLAVSERGAPCYRCLFEDVPNQEAGQNCDAAGVMGPVLGITGALMADLALDLLSGARERLAHIFTYDGKSDRLRRVPLEPRSSCPLCGPLKNIFDLDEARYLAPSEASSTFQTELLVGADTRAVWSGHRFCDASLNKQGNGTGQIAPKLSRRGPP